MATQSLSAVQPALLFMPDISGFTEFVTTTEIEHAQSIVQEVLELLVESNQLDLEVSEIEGDAVLFFRLGAPPAYAALLQQVQTMFTRFHQHLQLYQKHRICPCGACRAAANLKLKIIAHYGEVAGYSVQQHQKLFGKDVIMIHRLLKNSLNKKEYVLLTERLVNNALQPDELPFWYQAEEASESYDVGDVAFTLIDLTELHRWLPPPEAPAFHLSGKTKTVLSHQRLIPAPADEVFAPILNLNDRVKWMDGLQGVEMLSRDLINRLGTRHRCVFGRKNDPVMVTEYAHQEGPTMELIEMDEKGMAGLRYLVQSINENETRLTIDVLVKNNPLILVFFHLWMKKKLRKSIARSGENLYRLCTA